MTSKCLSILILIPVISANIQVNIVPSESKALQMVNFSGSSKGIISDTERNTFQLSYYNLEKAVQAYLGQQPTDAFLRSPTLWGNFYDWSQVSTTLSPHRAKILLVSSTVSIVSTQHFENNSTGRATFKTQMKKDLQNTITSTWEKDGDFSIDQNIQYNFNFLVVSVGGTTSLSYTSRWGESVSKSETVTVGSESSVEIALKPGQAVAAELHVTRGIMLVEVDYEATLSGRIANNYRYRYNGSRGLDINDVMRAGGLRTSVPSREVIKIGYYSNSTVVIRNA